MLDLGPDIAASDAALTEQYTFLLRSVHFKSLARMVNSNKKITLIDSSDIPNPSIAYDSESHRIYIPRDRSVEEIREHILWEMHNASMRGAVQRVNNKERMDGPDQHSSHRLFEHIDQMLQHPHFPVLFEHMRHMMQHPISPDQIPSNRLLDLTHRIIMQLPSEHAKKEIEPYKSAAHALSTEWYEWINTIEHDLRCQAINADPNMGGRGPHVLRRFETAYAQPGQAWYDFRNYLKEQIEGGEHTVNLDPRAADPSWVGKRFFAIVSQRNPNSLIIRPKQVQDWQSGKTKKVKSPSNNPFLSFAIIEEARRGF